MTFVTAGEAISESRIERIAVVVSARASGVLEIVEELSVDLLVERTS